MTEGSADRLLADEAPDDDSDAALGHYAEVLIAGIDAALPKWTAQCVEERMLAWSGTMPDDVRALAETAGERARVLVGGQIADLLRADIDDQRVPPLSILRDAVAHPTRVLEAAGVPHVQRDDFDVAAFPADVYGLAPATFADIDPALHEPGIAWGAAKAFVHLARRRAAGQR